MVADAIQLDPGYAMGEYGNQPSGLRFALGMVAFMSSNPVVRQREAPTGAAADKFLNDFIKQQAAHADANDILYAIESSKDYDPGPNLEKIQAPLLAINFADDLINPPELGILEKEIKRVKQGRALVIPQSTQTRGHGTHTLAAVWKEHLAELLRQSER
jgi:homoserine O-acetyltransferase